MTDKQNEKLNSKLDNEFSEYEQLYLSFQKQTIFDNSKEIFATALIYDYLIANGKNYDYNKLPKKNILEKLREELFRRDYGLSEIDIGELLEHYEEAEM